VIKRRFVFLVLLSFLLFFFISIVPANSQPQVEITASLSKYTVAPGGEFYANYMVTNRTTGDIIARVTERLENSPHSFSLEYVVPAQSEQKITGRSFTAFDGIGIHVLRYRVEYRPHDAHDTWIELASNFLMIETFADLRLGVTYNARHAQTVFRGQQVEYVVEVKSNANIPIRNLVVEDTMLGLIGEIALLEPGQTKTLTRSFILNQTTEGHIVIRFINPIDQTEGIEEFHNARVRVEVSQQQPLFAWELSGELDKQYIPHPEEVTFRLLLRNTGNVAIEDVEFLNWDGTVVHSFDRLSPDDEVTYEYEALIEPGKSYQVTVRGNVNGMDLPVETTYTLQASKLEPLVEIDRKVITDPQPGLRYTIKNIGNVALKDIVVEELELGVIARIGRMEPGGSVEVIENIDLNREMISRTILVAREVVNQTIYRFQAGEMIIGATEQQGEPHVTVSIKVEPDRLEFPGTISIESTIKNESSILLRNIEVIVKETDLNMGSLTELKPGDDHTFNISDVNIDLSQNLTVLVKVEDEQGNEYIFESMPSQVQVGQRDASLELVQSTEEARESFLRTIFGIIIILAILTAGFLIYALKNPLSSMKRKRRQAS